MKNSKAFVIPGAAVLAAVLSFPPAAIQAESLKERQTKISEAVAKNRPAVVCIQSRSARGFGSGSGVIVSADGLVLTAAHVVDAAGGNDEDTAVVSVVLSDGREVKGKVLGRDRGRDAAMVQLTEGVSWPHAQLAAADSVEQGEWCIAMGHPGGFDPQRGAPVRVGRLWLNNDKAFYRSDCTVSGGDSGGPLFDLDGRVIGIHSNISMNVAENRHVPVRVFHDDWERLKKGEIWGDRGDLLSESRDLTPKRNNNSRWKPEKKAPREPAKELREPAKEPAGPAKGSAFLGVAMQPSADGVTVIEIKNGSPAAKAGIELEDVITEVDGKAVGATGDVKNRVLAAAPGDKMKFTILRDGKEKEIEVTLAAVE